jgi:hypothetical protein
VSRGNSYGKDLAPLGCLVGKIPYDMDPEELYGTLESMSGQFEMKSIYRRKKLRNDEDCER